jgi:hypothetical protein
MASRVYLFVEGQSDKDVVFPLLLRAGLPLDRLEICPRLGGRWQIPEHETDPGSTNVALVDTDGEEIEAVRQRVANTAGLGLLRVFCAVPNIEAWLAADEETARSLAQFKARLPGRLSEDRVLPVLASCLDVDRAAGRMPSLREFLVGMSELLDGGLTGRFAASAGRTMSREVIAGLVREVPADEVVWRTMDGTSFTSRQLVDEIEAGTELGRQYAADLLRISRDLLKRKARRPA